MKPAHVAAAIVVLAGVLAFLLTPADPISFWFAWGATALVGLGGQVIARRTRNR